MRTTNRDAAIVRTVAQFKQLSTGQLAALFFHDNRSSERHKTVLKRLHDMKYLHRVERRMVGGSGHGSGQYVYSLGVNGFRFLIPRGGKFTPQRVVNYHALAIADAYVAMKQLEHAGQIEIKHWAVESRDINIAGIEIRPDLEVVFAQDGGQRHLWIEADLGSEDSRQLREKIERILAAKSHVGVYEEPDGSHRLVEPFPFPHVIFIVPDIERRNEIEYLLSRIAGARETFSVVLTEEFVVPPL